MNTETALNQAAELLAAWNQDASYPEPNRLDVSITPGDLVPATQALIDSDWGYLSAITGLDHLPVTDTAGETTAEGRMEALYHFCNGAAVAWC